MLRLPNEKWYDFYYTPIVCGVGCLIFIVLAFLDYLKII